MHTNSNLQVRLAQIDEIEAIASVLRQAFLAYQPLYPPAAFDATTPTAARIRERWDAGPVWVAVLNSNIVGTVAAVSTDSGLYVRSMAVLPASRGQGIGEKLLRATEDLAIELQHSRLYLSTTPYLKDAIRLYERFGFRINNEGPHDLFELPLFTMAKPLQEEVRLHEQNSHG